MQFIKEPFRHQLLGWFLILFSWLIFLLSLLLLFGVGHLINGAFKLKSWESFLVFIIAGGIFAVWDATARIITKMRSIGRALTAPSASKLIKKRKGDFILYLRSFSDDTQNEKTSMLEISVEEHMCRALDWIAPVIAIGKPGERLVTLGAARLYVGFDWEHTVTCLLKDARLVFIRLGTTRGLWWEICTTLDQVDPDRILMYFDTKIEEKDRKRFYGALVLEFNKRGYHHLPASLSNAAFLCFDKSGAGELLWPQDYADPKDKGSDLDWDVEATLTPIYRQLGISLPKRQTRNVRIALVVVSAIITVLFDQITKLFVTAYLQQHEIAPITSWMSATLVFNTGSAFSFTRDSGPLSQFSMMLAFVVIFYVILYVYKLPHNHNMRLVFIRLGIGMGIGGALGNLIDRARLGAVIDFIDLYHGAWHLPAFNIADVSITLGGLLWVVSSLLNPRHS